MMSKITFFFFKLFFMSSGAFTAQKHNNGWRRHFGSPISSSVVVKSDPWVSSFCGGFFYHWSLFILCFKLIFFVACILVLFPLYDSGLSWWHLQSTWIQIPYIYFIISQSFCRQIKEELLSVELHSSQLTGPFHAWFSSKEKIHITRTLAEHPKGKRNSWASRRNGLSVFLLHPSSLEWSMSVFAWKEWENICTIQAV